MLHSPVKERIFNDSWNKVARLKRRGTVNFFNIVNMANLGTSK